MWQVWSIDDTVYKVNDLNNVKSNKLVALALKNKLHIDFIKVYILFENKLFAVDNNKKRYIISNKCKIEDSWEPSRRIDETIYDMLRIKSYSSSLNLLNNGKITR